MRRTQTSNPTSHTTPDNGAETAPRRAYERSAYKLFPDPPSTTSLSPDSARTSPPRRAANNSARRSVSVDESGKSRMLNRLGAAELAELRQAQSPGRPEGKLHIEAESRRWADRTVAKPPTHTSNPTSPYGRERAASMPGDQKAPQAPYSQPPMSPLGSPKTRYYANVNQPGEHAIPDSDTAGDGALQYNSRVAQVQKLLAAGIKPPSIHSDSPTEVRSSSGSSNPVGLGLSFGSGVTTPDLAMFPRPGALNARPQSPAAAEYRPQSPNGYGFPRPHSPHGGPMPRPQSPGGYGMSRPQSPSRAPNSRPQSPSRLTRPQSPFSQPPPRPHSPNGFAPRHGSPLSGNNSRAQSPRPQARMGSPMYSPSGFGAKRMMNNDLRVDTSMRMPRPSPNHREMYSHQRQNTEYRRQMQGVQPLGEGESMPDMPRQQSTSPPMAESESRGRSHPDQWQHTQEQQRLRPEQRSGLRPTDQPPRKGIRKSRLAKPLPPPPPSDALMPPGPAHDPTSDISREVSRPGTPDSTTSSSSQISPVSPMYGQGYGYSNVAANAPTLPSPVSAITTLDFEVPSDAPDVPPIPAAVQRKPLSARKPVATSKPVSSTSTPPLSPPASKFQIKVNSPRTRRASDESDSLNEISSADESESAQSPRLTESPVRLEKAQSIQIQPFDTPIDEKIEEGQGRVISITNTLQYEEGVGHRRIPSLVPSLIDLKSPSEHKRPEAIKEETTPDMVDRDDYFKQQSRETEPQHDKPARSVAETAHAGQDQSAAESERSDSRLDSTREEKSLPAKQVERANLDGTVRSKSRARDLISKIEQKVQNESTHLETGSVGRRTPDDHSPAASLRSLKQYASREHLPVNDTQDASSSEQSGLKTDLAVAPLVTRKQVSPPAQSLPIPSPDLSMHSAREVLTPQPSATVDDQARLQEHEPVERAVPNAQEASTAAVLPSGTTGTIKTPLTEPSASERSKLAQSKTVQQQESRPLEIADPSTDVEPPNLGQSDSAINLLAKHDSISRTLDAIVKKGQRERTNTTASTKSAASSKQSTVVGSDTKVNRNGGGAGNQGHQFVVVKSKSSTAADAAKSFFMQEDIFHVEPEFPTYPNGILPVISEDGMQEEPEKRKSTSTMQSIPGKVSARQMARKDDRSSSRSKPILSSASSFASSHWSKNDDRPGSSKGDNLPGPIIAPFAREDRPSSTDTGVLPANENIKISTLSYESQLAAQTPPQVQVASPPEPVIEAPRSQVNTSPKVQDERLDVVRQSPANQSRPLSDAPPPPVPRKDTVRRPAPKRKENNDKQSESVPTVKPDTGPAGLQHSNQISRMESHGSVSSINLDAIRARVAGLSERTAKAIEAPSKDENTLLSTLEDLARQSETLHERYANLRADRQKLTNGMNSYLQNVRPGPGYVAALMDQNAAIASVMSSMDICFAKLKSLDCRKEEAIAALMANIHRKPSTASLTSHLARARGYSNTQPSTTPLSRGLSNATVVQDHSKQEAVSASQHKASPKVQTGSNQPTTPLTAAAPAQTSQPGPKSSVLPAEATSQAQTNGNESPRTRTKGAKAAKVLGLSNKKGEPTDKDVTLPDRLEQSENGSRLIVTVGPLKQAKTPPPSRPLPTPPERRRSIVDSVHASMMSLASTPEDPDLWTPQEDEVTPNALKGTAPPVRDVRVYAADDDFLDYYRNAP